MITDSIKSTSCHVKRDTPLEIILEGEGKEEHEINVILKKREIRESQREAKAMKIARENEESLLDRDCNTRERAEKKPLDL